MKNKFKFLIPIFFLCISTFNTLAVEDFIFESKSIEIQDNNNIIAKDGVKATTSDGLEIFADRSEYNKNTKILNLEKNVKLLDQIQNFEINSDNVIYDKILEKITAKKNTKIKIENSHIISGENIVFFRNELAIRSNNRIIIEDKFGNKIKLSGFIYSIETKVLKTNQMEFTDKKMNVYKTNNGIIDLNNERLAAKDVQIYFAKGELGENSRLKGSSLISENEISTIKNGIFTACKIRDDCPPWSLKSKEIKHDKKK